VENQAEENNLDYQSLVNKLAKSHPSVASYLQQAQENRTKRLAKYLKGARLKGLEELHIHLTKLERTFKNHPNLEKLAFLINRAKTDYAKALEATLSGLHSVAWDAMRDVMEIEFLLRDFYHGPSNINEWLTTNEKDRFNKFRPAELRKRHARRSRTKPQDVGEATDYKGHSMFLHVSPVPHPFGWTDFSEDDEFGADSSFWEIFEHARRFLFIAHKLVEQTFPSAPYNPDPAKDLPKVKKAWERTQEMQAIFLALIQTVKEIDSREDT
jgi:hypothetical protein